MEMIKVMIDDDLYDASVHGLTGETVLPEGGDVAIYIKKKATQGGRAGAVITWTAQTPDGKPCRVQAVITVRNLVNVLRIIETWQKTGEI